MADRSARLGVSPAVLIWARESAGLSVDAAATYLGQSVGAVHRWESGQEKPTVNALKRLATFYGRPLAALLLSQPRPRPLPNDFRVVAESEPLTKDSLFALRRATHIQHLLRDLDGSMFARPARPPLATELTAKLAEELAVAERERLGISVEAQAGWKDDYQALREWRAAVEDVGVTVLQASMPIEEIRGFALAGDPPIICLNTSDFPTARVFSLFHEYAHLLIGDGGICDADAGLRSTQTRVSVERFCNRFSGAILIPKAALLDQRSTLVSLRGSEPPADSAFSPLTSRFRVSRQVVWYRMRQLDLLSTAQFDAKWAQWASRTPRGRSGEGGGGMTRVERAFNECGRRLISAVVAAEARGDLGTPDALSLLRIRAPELSDVASAVGQ